MINTRVMPVLLLIRRVAHYHRTPDHLTRLCRGPAVETHRQAHNRFPQRTCVQAKRPHTPDATS
jgi:hypothetical protein